MFGPVEGQRRIQAGIDEGMKREKLYPAGGGDSLLRELTFLTQEREAIEEKLRQTCRAPRHEGRIKALKTLPGVGETVATTFAAELFRPGRFRHPAR
jgi:transposase